MPGSGSGSCRLGGALGELAQPGRPQRGLLWATTCATVREFVVDHHGRRAADTKFLGPLRYGALIHIQNNDLAGWASNAVDQFDGFPAQGASRTEHFDFSFCSL